MFQWDIVSNKIQLLATSKIVKLTAGDWESLSHLTNVYTKKIFHIPQVCASEICVTKVHVVVTGYVLCYKGMCCCNWICIVLQMYVLW